MLYTKARDGKLTSLNFMGTGGNVIATQRKGEGSGAWYLYNKDVRESTTSMINSAGELAKAYEYDEFGETTTRAGECFYNEIGYTGQVYDESTGLYYYKARFYDPEDGRFLSQDSYRGEQEKPDTLHLYAYCANNPVNFVDPSGHAFVRTYTRNQSRNTYYLFRLIDKTCNVIGWVRTGLALVKAKVKGKKKLIKEIKKQTASMGLSYFRNAIINNPAWLYGKLKKGFKYGGESYIRNRYYTKKGKFKEKYEKITKTKLIVKSPLNFNFYYSSKNKKDIPMSII